MTTQITPGSLLIAAFSLARAQYSDLSERWIALSFRMGGLLPESLLVVTLQQVGEMDLLCRSIEAAMPNELNAGSITPEGAPTMLPHYLGLLSSQWVRLAYAAHYTLKSRGLLSVGQDLYEDLRILRVQLEKHEVASDQKLKGASLQFTRTPDRPERNPYLYDPASPNRAHIAPCDLSQRGSMRWMLVDVLKNDQRWVERQALADQMLSTWSPLPTS